MMIVLMSSEVRPLPNLFVFTSVSRVFLRSSVVFRSSSSWWVSSREGLRLRNTTLRLRALSVGYALTRHRVPHCGIHGVHGGLDDVHTNYFLAGFSQVLCVEAEELRGFEGERS